MTGDVPPRVPSHSARAAWAADGVAKLGFGVAMGTGV